MVVETGALVRSSLGHQLKIPRSTVLIYVLYFPLTNLIVLLGRYADSVSCSHMNIEKVLAFHMPTETPHTIRLLDSLPCQHQESSQFHNDGNDVGVGWRCPGSSSGLGQKHQPNHIGSRHQKNDLARMNFSSIRTQLIIFPVTSPSAGPSSF